MTLKTKLNDLLKGQGTVTLDQLEQFCHVEKFKLATAERELRPSKMPLVERILKNGAIVGYRLGWCCVSYKHFETHDRSCDKLKEKPVNALW